MRMSIRRLLFAALLAGCSSMGIVQEALAAQCSQAYYGTEFTSAAFFQSSVYCTYSNYSYTYLQTVSSVNGSNWAGGPSSGYNCTNGQASACQFTV